MNDMQSTIQTLDKLLMSFYHSYINLYCGIIAERDLNTKNHVIKKLIDIKKQYDDYLFLYVGRYERDLPHQEKAKHLIMIVNTLNLYNIMYIMRYVMELIYQNDSIKVTSCMIQVEEILSKINKTTSDINFIY